MLLGEQATVAVEEPGAVTVPHEAVLRLVSVPPEQLPVAADSQLERMTPGTISGIRASTLIDRNGETDSNNHNNKHPIAPGSPTFCAITA